MNNDFTFRAEHLEKRTEYARAHLFAGKKFIVSRKKRTKGLNAREALPLGLDPFLLFI